MKKIIFLLFLIVTILGGCSINIPDDEAETDELEVIDPEFPNIITEAKYFHFFKKESVGDLKNFFTIYDVKDGYITVTDDMISGEISQGLNEIQLIVTDSDNNTSEKTIKINVGEYVTTKNKDSVTKLDKYTMPNSGNVKALVIPIKLSGSKPATEEMCKNLEKAFFGTEKDTGWESLKTYYEESSYGKLTISGSVTPWYTPLKSAIYYSAYNDYDDYYKGSTILLNEALEYYKDQYDYSDYDSDNDGYIDAVYLIYNTDIYGDRSQRDANFYWAYTSCDFNVNERTYANTKGYGYVFMGYDFFTKSLDYSNVSLKLNCETVIHETGHLLNLKDYYDYTGKDENNNDGGYCGIDMMDYGITDHGPLSKLLLNWIDPVVINKSGVYELPAFTTTGTTFIISADGFYGSVFKEYYLIDFFTFDGLNSLQSAAFFNTNKSYAGVRISHVDTTLTHQTGYFPYFTYNNSDTEHKIIRMLEADYKGIGRFDLDDSTNEGAKLSDFYNVGQSTSSSYSNYKSYNGNNIPFEMKVLKIENGIATVKITMK